MSNKQATHDSERSQFSRNLQRGVVLWRNFKFSKARQVGFQMPWSSGAHKLLSRILQRHPAPYPLAGWPRTSRHLFLGSLLVIMRLSQTGKLCDSACLFCVLQMCPAAASSCRKGGLWAGASPSCCSRTLSTRTPRASRSERVLSGALTVHTCWHAGWQPSLSVNASLQDFEHTDAKGIKVSVRY